MIQRIVISIIKLIKSFLCIHDFKYVNASWRTNGSCSDFEECKKCNKIKK